VKRLVPLLIVGAAILLFAGGLGYIWLGSNDSQKQSDSRPPSQSEEDSEPTELEKSQMVTLEGTYNCLQKSGDGPQTMECALGLILDDGTAYALSMQEPGLLAGVPTGARIEVTGPLQKVPDKTYQTSGTLEVHTFLRL